MKNNPILRNAIDESLSGVRFDAKDMRKVMNAVRYPNKKPTTTRTHPGRFRIGVSLAAAALLLLVLPLGIFTGRMQSMRAITVITAPGHTAAAPQETIDPHADRILTASAPAYSAGEREAILAARACFEAQCDTSLFTFEEYAVSVAKDGGEFLVTMECIYGNGCRFTVAVSAEDGSVLRHSTPRLATVPSFLDKDAPEVRAWYDKYGDVLFTWPQDAQAEFSRRYEGGALRTARDGELSAEEASRIAQKAAEESFGLESGTLAAAYPMLYDNRAEGAVYVVYCCTQPVTDVMPESYFIVSLLAADGTLIKVSAY